MTDDGCRAHNVAHLTQTVKQIAPFALHHGIGDAGQFANLRRNRATRIDQTAPFVNDILALEFHKTDFEDDIVFVVEPSRFNIE